MRRKLRDHFETIFIAAIVSLMFGGLPVVAAQYDAHNADKVDGKDAVGAGASKSNREGNLVAADGKGVLPNDIIVKAPNSSKLGGKTVDELLAAPNSTDLEVELSGLPTQPPSNNEIFGMMATVSNHGPAIARNVRLNLNATDAYAEGGGGINTVCQRKEGSSSISCGIAEVGANEFVEVLISWKNLCSDSGTILAQVSHDPSFDLKTGNDSDIGSYPNCTP